MDALELLLNRRSSVVRQMTEPGPSPDELKSIVAAGIRVPDHGKLFPWRLQVLDTSSQHALGDVVAGLYAQEHPDASTDEVHTERLRPQRAPVLVVVANRIQHDHPKIPALEQMLSGGAVCQNLLNAAHALGYTAQWLTEWPAYHADVKRALGHSPDDDIIGFVYIGSALEPPTERRRAQLEDVATYWDGPGVERMFPGVRPHQS